MGNLLEQLESKKKSALLGGGVKRIEAQHNKGKLTARERIEILVDHNSFKEIDMLVENKEDDNFVGDGVITGSATINGRLIFLYSQDFTVIGGSLGNVHAQKIAKIMDLAMQSECPIIGINDSGGARIQEGIEALAGYGEIFYRNVQASGFIPQISLIAGPCAGGAVYSPALTDFTFMVKDTSYMFVTGPDVVKMVTQEDITAEKLGGANLHASNTGVCDIAFDDEIQALLQIRKFVGFIPNSANSELPTIKTNDPTDRIDDSLNSLIPSNPNKPYDMMDLIYSIIDEDDFFELQGDFATNIITGFGRIGGNPIGILANQPLNLAGCLDIDASRKGARFIRFCDAFNIPIVTLIDVPGFLPGTNQEHNAIIKHGAKLLYAYAEATVPKISIITRKAYGGAYIVMNSKHLRGDFNYAWPNSEIAVMGAESAAKIIYRKYNDDPEQQQKLTDEYKEKFSNPFIAAAKGYVDEIILPQNTRKVISHALRILKNKKVNKINKKHDNLPL